MTGLGPQDGVDHVVLTRFNLPSRGPESIVRAREGWLRDRVALFERHTVPAMRGQTVAAFRWIVYLDPESPAWLIERLSPLADEGLIVPLRRTVVDWHDAAADARRVTGASHGILLTTNLDNDDAVAVDFVERLQASARRHPRAALFLRTGLILRDDRLYLRSDPENAFCSMSEPWDDPITAWRDWHTLLRTHAPVVAEPGAPGWLQIVHGRNVSNRVQGRLVDPAPYRRLFPGQLDGVRRPAGAQVWRDALIDRPARDAWHGTRSAGKDAFLRVFGKERLDAVKERLERVRSRSRPRSQ